jgi:hypothetical protein
MIGGSMDFRNAINVGRRAETCYGDSGEACPNLAVRRCGSQAICLAEFARNGHDAAKASLVKRDGWPLRLEACIIVQSSKKNGE